MLGLRSLYSQLAIDVTLVCYFDSERRGMLLEPFIVLINIRRIDYEQIILLAEL